MNLITKEAKTAEEALNNILEQNKLTREDIYFTEEIVKGKLFKASTYKVNVIIKEELMTYIKDFIKLLGKNMGLEISFESKIRDDNFNIKMFSDNNAILIGKNGQTLKALENIVKQKINNEYALKIKLFLDVENYNDKRIKNLERLAVNTAKEVINTKVDAILEDMNSYERRIIHNKLTNFKGIVTTSEGVEPHRHIIIKAE